MRRASRLLASAALCCGLAACAGAPPPRDGAASGAAPQPAGEPGAVADLVARADRELNEGRRASAEKLYRRAAELAPDDDRAAIGLARALLNGAQLPAAAAEADRAVALRASPAALALRARIHARSGRMDDAAADLERAVALAPRDGAAWTLLVAVHANRGDRVQVARAFSGAVSAMGRADAVNAVWTEMLSLSPDALQPQESRDRCARAYAALLDGDAVEAAREASNGLRFAPSFHWCGVVRAEALWRASDAAGAEQLLRWAIDGYPSAREDLRADAKGLLAEVLSLRKGAAAEVGELARAALAVRGERAMVLVALVRACDASGDAACARESAARILKLPNLPDDLRVEAERRAR